MNAKMQAEKLINNDYKIAALELDIILTLVRVGTLALAGERLKLDASTVFRSIQRIEKNLGMKLFERSRQGYRPLELAIELAQYAEQIEVQLELARGVSTNNLGQVAGSVRITSTDTVLHGLIAPLLKTLRKQHPLLHYDLHTGNELANLSLRDADIAVRATKRPPAHLVGRHLGPIRVALFASKKSSIGQFEPTLAHQYSWIAPDDALPDHPSVLWRRQFFPKISPAFRVNSILTVAELIGNNLGLGCLPVFLAAQRNDLVQISDVINECQTELWILTHTEARHFRRVSTVYAYLAEQLKLS